MTGAIIFYGRMEKLNTCRIFKEKSFAESHFKEQEKQER